ncbi:MAG: efflux RND transporter periplasmic adaptor subunit [Phycisphaerae bacterium]|nr:efflux RND transporter periplasmic adaptor subunit [Phycisphaerae bacterium]
MDRSGVKQAVRWGIGGIAFIVGVAFLMLWLTGSLHPKIRPTTTTERIEAFRRPLPAGASVVTVASVEVPVVETATGTIESAYRSEVASRLLAKVLEVRVSAGQKVRAGETIVVLDDIDLRSRVGQAEAAVAQTDAALGQAKLELERVDEAARAGAATAIEVDRIRSRMKEADANAERARRALDEAMSILSFATIASPMDGVVVDKRVQVGDTVAPGQAVASIYDPTRMQLVASVRETMASGLAVGRPITVRVDALGHACEGTVCEIVPQALAGSRSFQVKVTGPCPEGVYAGMFGRLIVPMGRESALTIPPAAVRRIGQLDVVDVVRSDDPTSVARRAVRLGRTVGDMIEVLAGLSAGEQVVVPEAARGEGAGS